MDGVFDHLKMLCKVLNVIAGTALTIMMSLTVLDVLLRAAGRPFVGTYEIVALLFGVVVGFGIPQASLDRGHVYMEFLVEKLSARNRNIMNTFTRILCLILFFLIGYNMIRIAARFREVGEVSPTISIPFYPLPYAVAVCCFIECLVFVFDIVRVWRGEYE